MPGIADRFRVDVLAGLRARPRAIPARWFYDRRGSELFEDITRLPEYYPPRIETALIETHARHVADSGGLGRAIVEFGAGSSTKTRPLIEALAPLAYVPVDISGDFLRESAAALERDLALPVFPVEADFTQPWHLPDQVRHAPLLGFFPGSTIGNFTAAAAVDLLRSMAASLGEGALLLIGMDRIKPVETLIAAYDDVAGVTAAFNLNLLVRINRELGGDMPLDAFVHRARWNDAMARIEMHLEATRAIEFTVAGQRFTMDAGETIHSENSHKYGPREARLLLAAGGWTVRDEWTDADGAFALILAEVSPPPIAP
jgi:L-histidine N-alpha-methyltransferase